MNDILDPSNELQGYVQLSLRDKDINYILSPAMNCRVTLDYPFVIDSVSWAVSKVKSFSNSKEYTEYKNSIV